MRNILLLCAASGALLACTSPESTRVRGGGPGADQGNRGAVVRMHHGALPYWQTPDLVPGEPPPLDGARQAERLSRE